MRARVAKAAANIQAEVERVIRLIFSALAVVALLSVPVHAATEETAQDTSSPPSHEQPEDEESGEEPAQQPAA